MKTDPLVITAIRHWLIYIPFDNPIVWGSGKRAGSTRLVVEVTTAGGVKGYGETISLLDFVPVVLEKVVVPLALGRRVSDTERLHRHVMGAGYYHHERAVVMALTAVEMAMWDALGRHAGLPLHQLWGGAYRSEIEVSAYLSSPTRRLAAKWRRSSQTMATAPSRSRSAMMRRATSRWSNPSARRSARRHRYGRT